MIYIVYQHDFDNGEHFYPHVTEEIGYGTQEKNVRSWIDTEDKKLRKYQGWDKKWYPYFTYKAIRKL